MTCSDGISYGAAIDVHRCDSRHSRKFCYQSCRLERDFDVVSFDPLILVACISIIVILGFTASYLPARRATRVNPVAALRHE